MSILENKTIIVKTWKGNSNGTILLALPNIIAKEYHLENPQYLILERHQNGIFLRKLNEVISK